MFKKFRERRENPEDFFYHREADLWVSFLFLISSFFAPFMLILLVLMVVQILLSMMLTYQMAGKHFYYKKNAQKVQVEKVWLTFFVSWGYPQMWDGHQVGWISDEYLIWNLRSKPPKQGLLVDDLPKDITDHDTIYDKIERREEKGEKLLDLLYIREIETTIFFILLSFIIIFPPIIVIILAYLIWLLMSIFFPPMKRGEKYSHKRSWREVTVIKPYWIFSKCEFPQIRHDCEVGVIDDFYLNWTLKKLPQKKASRINEEWKFE